MPLAHRTSPLTGRPASSRPLGDGSTWTWFSEEDGTTYAATDDALRILAASPPTALAAVMERVRRIAGESRCSALVSGAERRRGIGAPPGPLDFRLIPV